MIIRAYLENDDYQFADERKELIHNINGVNYMMCSITEHDIDLIRYISDRVDELFINKNIITREEIMNKLKELKGRYE